MTFECLPAIVRERLQSLAEQRGFKDKCDYSLQYMVHGDVGSSCLVCIKDENNQMTVFVKYLIAASTDQHMSEGLLYYNNEAVFYGEILPLFRDLENDTENEICRFAPNCLYVGGIDNKQPFVIMEDVIAAGYRPFSAKESLCLERAKDVVDQLGKFHAFSFAVKDQRPQEFAEATSKLFETVFSPDAGVSMEKIFIRSIHDAYKLTKQSLPADSVYVEKFAAFTLNVYERIAGLVTGDEDLEYKVVTHGDLWANNILFQNNDEDNKDTRGTGVKFVDFQGSRLASPVHDLMFVLLVSLDKLTRIRHREELIRHYHRSLCCTLQALGSDPLRIFPYSALEQQIVKHSQVGLSLVLVGLPLHFYEQDAALSEDVSNAPPEGRNVEDLFEFLQVNKSMKCKNKMLEIIMDSVDHGYL